MSPDPEFIDDLPNTVKKKKKKSTLDDAAFTPRWKKPEKPYASKGRQRQLEGIEDLQPSSPKRKKPKK